MAFSGDLSEKSTEDNHLTLSAFKKKKSSFVWDWKEDILRFHILDNPCWNGKARDFLSVVIKQFPLNGNACLKEKKKPKMIQTFQKVAISLSDVPLDKSAE